MENEYFGSPERISLLMKGAALWQLVRNDPVHSFYGRMVAVSEPDDNIAQRLMAMATLQGASVCYYLPKTSYHSLSLTLSESGFGVDRWEHFRGGEETHAASCRHIESNPLPADISLVRIDGETSAELVRAAADLCSQCDVMPVPGAVMRCQSRSGITLVAVDNSGAPVAHAASYVIHHENSARKGDVFWGMLATRPDRRGQKIALHLGALAAIEMVEHHGARGFITGVRSGNTSSEKICAKLGVKDTEWVYAQCIDRAQMGEKPLTR